MLRNVDLQTFTGFSKDLVRYV